MLLTDLDLFKIQGIKKNSHDRNVGLFKIKNTVIRKRNADQEMTITALFVLGL